MRNLTRLYLAEANGLIPQEQDPPAGPWSTAKSSPVWSTSELVCLKSASSHVRMFAETKLGCLKCCVNNFSSTVKFAAKSLGVGWMEICEFKKQTQNNDCTKENLNNAQTFQFYNNNCFKADIWI